MIEYDYKILRDEGDEQKEYGPKEIPKELNNITYIEAPNSSGKSTLLNILAISFFAHRLESGEIADSLRNKIKNLLESDHQSLVFKILISDSNNNPIIKVEKNDYNSTDIEFQQYEDGIFKPMSFDRFKRKYKLIYDIPEKPTERINNILHDINIDLKTKVDRLKRFLGVVSDTIKEVSSAKNVDEINSLKKKIEENSEKIKKINDNISRLEGELMIIEIYHDGLAYKILLSQIEEKQKYISILKGKKTRKNNVVNKVSGKLQRLLNQRQDLLNNINDNLNYIRNINVDNDIKLHEIESLTSEKILKEVQEYNNHYYFRNKVNKFKDIVDKEISRIENDKLFTEAVFIQELKYFLEKYSKKDIALPSIQMSIQQYIKTLDINIKKSKNIINRKHKYDNILECFDAIDDDATTAIKLQQSIEKQKDYTNKIENEHDIDSIIASITTEEIILERYLKEERELKKRLIKNNIDPSNINVILEGYDISNDARTIAELDDEKYANEIDSLISEIDQMKDDAKRLEDENRFNNITVKKNESKNVSKYQNYKKDLSLIHDKLFNLISKIENKYIVGIDNIYNISAKNLDQEFLLILSEYLAQKIITIRHIDKTYKLRNIDLLNKKVVTQSNKVIRFDDLGTGQSQSAYIDSLLSIRDDRKIIALFDEVGMMDNRSLHPINEKISKLYKKNKLLIGVIVQRGNDVKIRSIT